jgi:hypothetical protein
MDSDFADPAALRAGASFRVINPGVFALAKTMEKMHNEDPKKWGKQMKPKWEAAPEA